MEENLFYWKSTDFHLNTFIATWSLAFDQTSGNHNLAKVTYKTNCHTIQALMLPIGMAEAFAVTAS